MGVLIFRVERICGMGFYPPNRLGNGRGRWLWRDTVPSVGYPRLPGAELGGLTGQLALTLAWVLGYLCPFIVDFGEDDSARRFQLLLDCEEPSPGDTEFFGG